jgi:hypothetical protein
MQNNPEDGIIAKVKKKRKGKTIEGVHGKRRLDRPARKSGGRIGRDEGGGVLGFLGPRHGNPNYASTGPQSKKDSGPDASNEFIRKNGLDKPNTVSALQAKGSLGDVGIKAIPNKSTASLDETSAPKAAPKPTPKAKPQMTAAQKRLAEIDAEGRDKYDEDHGIGKYAKSDNDEGPAEPTMAERQKDVSDDLDKEDAQGAKRGGAIRDAGLKAGSKDMDRSIIRSKSAGPLHSDATRKRGGRC